MCSRRSIQHHTRFNSLVRSERLSSSLSQKSCAGKWHRSPVDPPPKHTKHTSGERALHSACIEREETVGARALTSPGCLGCDMAVPVLPLLHALHAPQSERHISNGAHLYGRGAATHSCSLPVRALLPCACWGHGMFGCSWSVAASVPLFSPALLMSTSHEKNVRALSTSSTLYHTQKHVYSYFIGVLGGQAHSYRYLN